MRYHNIPHFTDEKTESQGYYDLLSNLVPRFAKLLDIPFAAVQSSEQVLLFSSCVDLCKPLNLSLLILLTVR